MDTVVKNFLPLLLIIAFTTSISCESKFYSFSAKDIKTGNEVSFDKYKGRVVMVVNVASYDDHADVFFHQLVELQRYFPYEKFAILAFPSNQFGEKEPKTDNSEIWKLVNATYKVNFDMFEKIDVVGEKAHPLYQWLKTESESVEPTWNFCKYLLTPEGGVLRFTSAWLYPNQFFEDIENMIAGKEVDEGLWKHHQIFARTHTEL